MRPTRPGSAFTFLAAAATALLLAACGSNDDPVDPDPRLVLTVGKAGDDGSEGTLRWAILQSNASPGKFRIVLAPDSSGQLVIKPTSLLPGIVGPARIEGPWTGTGAPAVALDGSALFDLTVFKEFGVPLACPGEIAGQYGPNARSLQNAALKVVDSRDVEFSGFEIRNFCTGIMVLRSKNNRIHHMRFFNNLGAAGVLLTGDDGTAAGGATALSGNNLVEHSDFLNNSDALDLARGEEGTVVRFNTLRIDSRGIPSSGIEITNANRDTVEDNTLSGFAEALQIGGNGHVVSRNTLTGNSVAFSMSGTGNVVTGNIVRANRAGIAITSNPHTLSQNLVSGNGLDISACAPGNGVAPTAGGVCLDRFWLTSRLNVSYSGRTAPTLANDPASACSDGFADCDATQNYPVLAGSVFQPSGFVVNGSVITRPNQALRIEVFASHQAGPDNLGDGEVYLGRVEVNSGASGVASFSFPTGTANPLNDASRNVYFTATATRVSNGSTSEYSRPQLVAGQ